MADLQAERVRLVDHLHARGGACVYEHRRGIGGAGLTIIARMSLLMLLMLMMLLAGGCAADGDAQHAGAGSGVEGGDGASQQRLRIMSFNIRYGTANDGENRWANRSDLVMDVIRKHEPDIIGVQEALAFQLDELAEALPMYARLGVGRDDGISRGEHAAILYQKDRFVVEEESTFWFSDTPGVAGSMSWGNRITRICTWARLLDRSSRRTFYIYNVHLDHQSQPSRERSSELLMQRIAQRAHRADPVIITGDFNAGPGNAAIRTVLAAEGAARVVDCYRMLHEPGDEEGTFNSFRGERSGERIDYIFCSPMPGFAVRACDILHDDADGRYSSDHFPVLAELELMPVTDEQ